MSDTIEKLTTLDQKFEYLNYSSLDRTVFLMSYFYDFEEIHAELNHQISEKNSGML